MCVKKKTIFEALDVEFTGRNMTRDLSKLVLILVFGNFQLGLSWQLTYHRKNVIEETGFTTTVTFWGFFFLATEGEIKHGFPNIPLDLDHFRNKSTFFPFPFDIRGGLQDGNSHMGDFYFKTLTILRLPFFAESNCMHHVQSLTISNASIDQSRSSGRQPSPAQHRREQTLEKYKTMSCKKMF